MTTARIQSYLATPQGDAIITPLHIFLDTVLPRLKDHVDMDQVMRKILSRDMKSFSPVTLRGRWRGFPQDPQNSRLPVHRVFTSLKSVVVSILQAAKVSKASFTLSQNPTAAYTSYLSQRKPDTLPDVYFSYDSVRGWRDITVFGEFSKGSSENNILENITKVTTSMHMCMQNDPRRRFLHSFTIENKRMRLWFCDRTRILVSEPFEFITNHRPLVRFILSVAYASAEDIGLDPTMVQSRDGQSYDIALFSQDGDLRTYRTCGRLSSTGRALQSRVTRVWKAVRVEDGQEVGEPVVLKDTWVNATGSFEGDILADLVAHLPEDDQPKTRDCLPSVECHGKVYLDDDRTTVDNGCLFAISNDLSEQWSGSRDRPLWYRTVAQKNLVHYRIVFKDVCTPLDKETSLAAIFRALSQTVLGTYGFLLRQLFSEPQVSSALQTIHDAGWVHRDVSSKNILLKENGQPILADLELAKRVGSGDEYPVVRWDLWLPARVTSLTSLIEKGTSGFMSVEVETQDYKFLPTNLSYDPEEDLNTALERAKADMFGRENEVEFKVPPFQYNPLHDLESLWWVAVYFVVVKQVVRTGETDPPVYSLEPQRAYATELFTNWQTRWLALYDDTLFLERSGVLPQSTKKVLIALDGLRNVLHTLYFRFERDFSVSEHGLCPDRSYKSFAKTFKIIGNATEILPLISRPFPPPIDILDVLSPAPVPSSSSHGSRKRSRDSPDVDLSAVEDDHSDIQSKKIKTTVSRRPYLPRKAKNGMERR
ncbi:hypothetical protein EIP86_009129 [Pleurotus ostreatoroseus]|nr:hypothetical protein EIP86_009129 [Pleurotus ostreatoroseus]